MDNFFKAAYDSKIKKDLLSNCKMMRPIKMKEKKKPSDRFIPNRLNTCQSVNDFSLECELNKENQDSLNVMIKE